MDIAVATSLLAKVLWSAAIVLGLSAIAERLSTRIAGVLSAAPLNTVLVYFFVGQDMGAAFVVASVPHGVAACAATLAFVLAYHQASSLLNRFAAAGSALIALLAFAAAAIVLAAIPFDLTSAVAVTLCAIALALWRFRTIAFAPVARPVRYTGRLLLLRGGLAAVLVVAAITTAEALGTRWTGLMTGFPTTLLPTLIIVHTTYGRANTHALMRNFPIGLVSIVFYIASVPVTFSAWGIYGGTAASLTIALVYLTIVMAVGTARRRRIATGRQHP